MENRSFEIPEKPCTGYILIAPFLSEPSQSELSGKVFLMGDGTLDFDIHAMSILTHFLDVEVLKEGRLEDVDFYVLGGTVTKRKHDNVTYKLWTAMQLFREFGKPVIVSRDYLCHTAKEMVYDHFEHDDYQTKQQRGFKQFASLMRKNKAKKKPDWKVNRLCCNSYNDGELENGANAEWAFTFLKDLNSKGKITAEDLTSATEFLEKWLKGNNKDVEPLSPTAAIALACAYVSFISPDGIYLEIKENGDICPKNYSLGIGPFTYFEGKSDSIY